MKQAKIEKVTVETRYFDTEGKLVTPKNTEEKLLYSIYGRAVYTERRETIALIEYKTLRELEVKVNWLLIQKKLSISDVEITK